MDPLLITYRFTFGDGRSRDFEVRLDRATLTCQNHPQPAPPNWAELEQCRCDGCPLDASRQRHCPIALNLAEIVETFKECFSYETVQVAVITEERTTLREVTVQEGLSPLLGIVMVTSGCPTMEPLKPMVRFHLPFASVEETAYRMLSNYLVAQLYRYRRGLTPDWGLTGLHEVYEAVGQVNDGFANRLAEAARRDANINALVKLDCFAKLVPMTLEDLLAEMEGYFRAYLSPAAAALSTP